MTAPLYEICQHSIAENGNVLGALALAGFAGGFTHCAGMCGPFAMAQMTARLSALPVEKMNEGRRILNAALLPYQLGRVVSYGLLGLLVSVFTQGVVQVTGFRFLSAFLLIAGGVLFLLSAFAQNGLMMAGVRTPSYIAAFHQKISTWAKPFFAKPYGKSGFILGMLLGLLPCGMLYSALFVASAHPPLIAVTGMVLFSIGTVPALFTVSYGTQFFGARFRPAMQKLGQAFMVINGFLLLALGTQKLLV